MEYRSLITNIRNFVSSADHTRTDAAAGWAQQYAAACQDVNDRLRRCADFLRQGLRSEAIHLAESPPDVLDMVATLDFPELAQWLDVTTQYNWPAAPALDFDAAAAVNQAYGETTSTDALLATHRILALARGPLTQRIATLRKLAAVEPAVPFWRDDQAALERDRQEQIHAEFSQAAQRQDLHAAERMAAEANGGDWAAPVPPELKRFIEQNLAMLRQSAAVNELRQLLPKLHDAHAAMSLAAARPLLAQWTEISGRAGVAVPEDLREQVEPIAGWAAAEEANAFAQEAFDRLVADLQQALDTDRPTPELQQLHREAAHYPFPLPEALLANYQQTLHNRDAAALRRRRGITAVYVAAALLVAGGIATAAYIVVQDHRATDWRKALAAADNGVRLNNNLQQAVAILAQAKAARGISTDPAIAAATTRLLADIGREEARRAQFAKFMKNVRRAGVKHPDQRDLAAAGRIAAKAREKALVATWRENIKAYRTAARNRYDARTMVMLSQICQQIRNKLTRKGLRTAPRPWAKALRQLKRRAAVASTRPSAAPAVAALEQATSALLTRRSRWLNNLGQQEGDRARIFNSTSVAGYLQAAQQYLKDLPAGRLAPVMQAAVEHANAARAADAWGNLVAQWHGKLAPKSRFDATGRTAQIAAFLKAYPHSAWTPAVAAYSVYLKQFLIATSRTGPWQHRASALLHNHLIDKLKTARDSNGVRYYVYGKPRFTRDAIGWSFNHVAKTPNLAHLRHESLGPGVRLTSQTPMPAGQCVFARKALRVLNLEERTHWDTVGFTILKLAMHQKMNLAIKGLLVQMLLRYNRVALGPLCQSQRLTAASAALHALKLDNVNWLKPHQPGSASKRRKPILRALEVINGIAQVKHAVAAHEAKIREAVDFRLSGLGVAQKKSGGWRVSTDASVRSGDTAWVARPAGAGTHPAVQVASYQHGHWTVAGGNNVLRSGQLVFVCRGR